MPVRQQIKRWFYYRYMRDHAHDPRSTDPSNPYNAIIMQLSGLSSEKRPRCKAPINIWCKEPESVQAIQAEWDKIGTTIPATKRAAKRAELASALFKALLAERQKYYADRAKEEHQVALKKWTAASMGEVSTAPADRQRYVHSPCYIAHKTELSLFQMHFRPPSVCATLARFSGPRNGLQVPSNRWWARARTRGAPKRDKVRVFSLYLCTNIS